MMRFSRVAAPVAGAVLLVFGSYASANVTRPANQVTRPAGSHHRIQPAGPFASERLNYQFYHRPIVRMVPQGTVLRGAAPDCPYQQLQAKTHFLFASDNTTGDLDWFCEDTDPKTGQHLLLATVVGGAGWGLATTPSPIYVNKNGKRTVGLAAGKIGGTISLWKDVETIATQPPDAVLTLSGQGAGDNAYGICWDDKGGLYATNWPGNTIDYFANAAAGGAPTNTITTTTVTEDFYVACDFDANETGNNGDLLVYGYNLANGDADLAKVTLPNGPDVVVDIVVSWNNQTGFPGGITFNQFDELIINDQYGYMYDLGRRDPSNVLLQNIRWACSWGFNPNDFTNISFDQLFPNAREVWASNINFGGANVTTYLQNVTYPLPVWPGDHTKNPPPACVTGGPSGGATQTLPGESSYNGVAVSHPSEV